MTQENDMSEAPDANCYTLPDGSCVGVECMHDPKPRGSWSGVLTNPDTIARKRQEYRETWDDVVAKAWDTLGSDQQEHCTNQDTLLRWWPGTKKADHE
jgi:hypothetical protein